MAKVKQRQLGGLPPKYSFMVNSYPEERVSRCPLCPQLVLNLELLRP
jgi:hypothetical protein